MQARQQCEVIVQHLTAMILPVHAITPPSLPGATVALLGSDQRRATVFRPG
jgi:hypothetical protein